MIECVDSMIYNADVYKGNDSNLIWRYTPPGQYGKFLYAYKDIDNIEQAAKKCIDIIDKHDIPK